MIRGTDMTNDHPADLSQRTGAGNEHVDRAAAVTSSREHGMSSMRAHADRLERENELMSRKVDTLDERVASLRARNEVLSSRVEALRERLSHSASRANDIREARDKLRDSNETLREQLRETKSSLRTEILSGRERMLEERARRNERAEKLLATNSVLREALRDRGERAAAQQEKNREVIATLRDRTADLNTLWRNSRRFFTVFRQGLLFDEIEKLDVDFSADTYLSLLPSTVPAAMTLQRRHGGRVICDCVENVEVERHSLAPNIHPTALQMVNLMAYGALSQVDGMMTVSSAVAETLERFGPPVRLQPNYRWYEEAVPSGRLRARVGLPEAARVLVTTGNIVNGFEAIVDAIAGLPEDVHLVAFARFSPSGYADRVREHVIRSGMEHRVHLLSFVPYDELAGMLADADAGIITLDPENPNHSVSLPNRVFDFTTAGLPFLAPPLREIKRYIDEHGCGIAISDVTAESWRAGIATLLDGLPRYREAMIEARRRVTWNSLEDGLVEFLGNPTSVTLLGFRDLSRYQRFLRVTDTLTSRGISVKAIFFSENPQPLKNRNAEFYHFTDRYGRSEKPQRVPYAE